MRKYLFITIIFAAICGYYSNAFAGARAGVGVVIEEPVNPDVYYYDYPVWNGPGLYLGVWFGDEMSYHNWHRHHRNHGPHHGGHHGGSRGHQGGGHGGHGGGHGGHGGHGGRR